MENVQVTPTPIATPEVAPAPVQVSQPVVASSQMENGGAMDSITKGKMNIKDIVISAGLIVLAVYGTWYYKKAIKALDEQPTVSEFDSLSDRVDEVMRNLKTSMGNKYKTI